MAIPIGDIVEVRTIAEPTTVVVRYGDLMFVSPDQTLDAAGAGKVKAYATFAELAEDFDSADEPYKAALSAYGQTQAPRRFLVGRRVAVNAPHEVRGGTPTPAATISASAISDGVLTIGTFTINNISISSGDDANDIATAIQTRMVATTGLAGSSVAGTDTGYTVTIPNDVAITGPFVDSTASGTDLAEDLGLRVEDGATFHQGADTETMQDSLDAIQAVNQNWNHLTLDAVYDGTSDMGEAASWALANKKILHVESNEVAAKVANDASAQISILANTENRRASGTWAERVGDYQAVSIASRFGGIDWNAQDSLITAKFRTLPGRTASRLSATERGELDRKSINYYTPAVGRNIYGEGYTLSGEWLDEVIWLDWLANTIQLEIFNLLISDERVPQTPVGSAIMKTAVEGVCRIGRRNGGIGAGRLSAARTAEVRAATGRAFDGFLSNGYLVNIGSYNDQTDVDRGLRKSPPINVWLTGSGAVHFASVSLKFEG